MSRSHRVAVFRTSQKIVAPLLGLAKSMYWYIVRKTSAENEEDYRIEIVRFWELSHSYGTVFLCRQ